MSKATRTRFGRDGFTLVETLVTFTILAFATVAIQRAVTVSADGVSRAESRIDAEMVARTLMSGPLGSGPAATQRKTGRMNGMEWAIRFEPIDLPPANTMDTSGNQHNWLPLRMIIEVYRPSISTPDLVVETVRLVDTVAQR